MGARSADPNSQPTNRPTQGVGEGVSAVYWNVGPAARDCSILPTWGPRPSEAWQGKRLGLHTLSSCPRQSHEVTGVDDCEYGVF